MPFSAAFLLFSLYPVLSYLYGAPSLVIPLYDFPLGFTLNVLIFFIVHILPYTRLCYLPIYTKSVHLTQEFSPKSLTLYLTGHLHLDALLKLNVLKLSKSILPPNPEPPILLYLGKQNTVQRKMEKFC